MTILAPVALPTYGAPPSTSDPANFETRMDAKIAADVVLVPLLNIELSKVYSNAQDAAASANSASIKAGDALTQAGNAAASALTALNAPGTSATSSTSATVATGNVSITIQAGKAFDVGQFLVAASTASPANYMIGQITAYTSGTGALTLNVFAYGGAGTFMAWTVSLTLRDASVATLAGVETLTNKTITDTVYAVTGTTPALAATNGAVQTWTLTANSTPTSSLTSGQSIVLGILDGTAYSITWPSVVWSKQGGSGAAPSLNATLTTWVVLWKVGSTLFGSYLGDA